MPVLSIEAGQLSNEQKRELVITLTREAASIMTVPEQSITVLIKENNKENIGFAGVWFGDK